MADYSTFTEEQLNNGYEHLKKYNMEDIFNCFCFSQEEEKNRCIECLYKINIFSGGYLEIEDEVVYTCNGNVSHIKELIKFAELGYSAESSEGFHYKACCYMYQLIKYIQRKNGCEDSNEPVMEVFITLDEIIGLEDSTNGNIEYLTFGTLGNKIDDLENYDVRYDDNGCKIFFRL